MATSGNPPSLGNLLATPRVAGGPGSSWSGAAARPRTRLKWHEALGLRWLQFEPLEQRALLSMTALQFNYVYDPTTQSPVIGSPSLRPPRSPRAAVWPRVARTAVRSPVCQRDELGGRRADRAVRFRIARGVGSGADPRGLRHQLDYAGQRRGHGSGPDHRDH